MAYVFTEDPRVIGAELERATGALIRIIMTRAWENLVDDPNHGGTPIDTEFASASWMISFGTPGSGVAGSKKSVDHRIGEETVALLQNYQVSWGAVFLVNNSAYIMELNYGWSPQASPGFIERAFEDAISSAESIRDIGDL